MKEKSKICSRCNEKPAAICISCLTDCTLKQQPTAGEFTKNIRDVLKVMDDDGKFHRKIMEEAIEIIDRAESINTDLLAACEAVLPFVVAHDIQHKTVSGVALQIQAAISKSKKEG